MIARVGKKNEKAGSSGFKYRKRTAESVKKRADQTGGNFDSPVKSGIDMFRPGAGESVIRILPPTWDDFEHYGFDVYMHRFIGSDSSNYICLNKMKGKHCPACSEAKSLKDDGEDDEAKALSFSKRCWVWIIDRSDKSETPQVWDMSWAQDRDIAGLSHFKSGKILLIDHPDEGYDIIVKKTGQGLKTKYHFNIERDSSPISDDDDKQEEILNFITENPIPDVLHFFSADHIEKKLAGTTEEKDKDLDEDEDEKPKKKRAGRRDADEDEDEDEKPKRKKRPAAEDDDDEDETPRRKKRPAADDDDEDEAPKKKRKPVEEDDDDEDERPKKKRKPVEEDEDDEDERPKKRRKPADEDDDEDEAPKKKRKPAPADDDDEDEAPKKKRKPVEEDDDDEDEAPKKKKRKPVEEDDDDEDEAPKRRRR